MAGPILYGPSKNAKPVRKDQRFPPRYPGAQRPKGKGRGITAIQFVKKVDEVIKEKETEIMSI